MVCVCVCVYVCVRLAVRPLTLEVELLVSLLIGFAVATVPAHGRRNVQNQLIRQETPPQTPQDKSV